MLLFTKLLHLYCYRARLLRTFRPLYTIYIRNVDHTTGVSSRPTEAPMTNDTPANDTPHPTLSTTHRTPHQTTPKHTPKATTH